MDETCYSLAQLYDARIDICSQFYDDAGKITPDNRALCSVVGDSFPYTRGIFTSAS